jgi:hypothetical protein
VYVYSQRERSIFKPFGTQNQNEIRKTKIKLHQKNLILSRRKSVKETFFNSFLLQIKYINSVQVIVTTVLLYPLFLYIYENVGQEKRITIRNNAISPTRDSCDKGIHVHEGNIVRICILSGQLRLQWPELLGPMTRHLVDIYPLLYCCTSKVQENKIKYSWLIGTHYDIFSLSCSRRNLFFPATSDLGEYKDRVKGTTKAHYRYSPSLTHLPHPI